MSEDRHPAAADEPVVPAVVVIESKGEDFGSAAGREVMQGLLLDLGFHTPAAESTCLRTVREREHRRPGFLRRRPAGGRDHAPDARLPAVDRGDELRKQVGHDVTPATRSAPSASTGCESRLPGRSHSPPPVRWRRSGFPRPRHWAGLCDLIAPFPESARP